MSCFVADCCLLHFARLTSQARRKARLRQRAAELFLELGLCSQGGAGASSLLSSNSSNPTNPDSNPKLSLLCALLAAVPLNAFGLGPEGADGQLLAPAASSLSGTLQTWLGYCGLALRRYANHSCVPNCLERVWGGCVRLLALRDIDPEEEITPPDSATFSFFLLATACRQRSSGLPTWTWGCHLRPRLHFLSTKPESVSTRTGDSSFSPGSVTCFSTLRDTPLLFPFRETLELAFASWGFACCCARCQGSAWLGLHRYLSDSWHFLGGLEQHRCRHMKSTYCIGRLQCYSACQVLAFDALHLCSCGAVVLRKGEACDCAEEAENDCSALEWKKAHLSEHGTVDSPVSNLRANQPPVHLQCPVAM